MNSAIVHTEEYDDDSATVQADRFQAAAWTERRGVVLVTDMSGIIDKPLRDEAITNDSFGEHLLVLLDRLLERKASPPHVLYHYTDAGGLLGILTSSRVWATNLLFMNDPSEVRYAERLIYTVLDEKERELAPAPGTLDGVTIFTDPDAYYDGKFVSSQLPLQTLRTWIELFRRGFENEMEAYIACFCAKGDLLSQWRGYGPAGRGYSIGFRATHLERCARMSAEGSLVLRKIIYDPQVQRRIVSDWVDAFLRSFPEDSSDKTSETHSPSMPVDLEEMSFTERQQRGLERLKQRLTEQRLHLDQRSKAIARFVWECLLCFKDQAFKEEEEWRLVQFGRDAMDPKFRVKGGHLVPYVELDLTLADKDCEGRLPIDCIIPGPTLDTEATHRSLSILLKAHGYRKTEVCASQIPFREWTSAS